MGAPFGPWGTQTFIAGPTANAMIAPLVTKGALDGAAFAAYIQKVLVPELLPGTVAVLDNLATHENVEAAKVPIPHDEVRYRKRHKIGNSFVLLKDWRRVATRYDRRPKVFLSACALAAVVMFWFEFWP